MKHTYEDYFNAAKEIFRPDALTDHHGWYFDLDGEVIFGHRCGYTILQYDKEYLFIPYKLELEGNGWIRPKEKDRDETAIDIKRKEFIMVKNVYAINEKIINYENIV